MKKQSKKFFSEIGSKGGSASKGGGRPRIPDEDLTPEQLKRRQRYLKGKNQCNPKQ